MTQEQFRGGASVTLAAPHLRNFAGEIPKQPRARRFVVADHSGMNRETTMSSQELCASMRWIEAAQAAYVRCLEAVNDREAAALAIVLRAAIHAKTEALRAHVRLRIAQLA